MRRSRDKIDDLESLHLYYPRNWVCIYLRFKQRVDFAVGFSFDRWLATGLREAKVQRGESENVFRVNEKIDSIHHDIHMQIRDRSSIKQAVTNCECVKVIRLE